MYVYVLIARQMHSVFFEGKMVNVRIKIKAALFDVSHALILSLVYATLFDAPKIYHKLGIFIDYMLAG